MIIRSPMMYVQETVPDRVVDDLHVTHFRGKSLDNDYRAIQFDTQLGHVVYQYVKVTRLLWNDMPSDDHSFWRLVDSTIRFGYHDSRRGEIQCYPKAVEMIDNMDEKALLILGNGVPCWDYEPIPVTKVSIIYREETATYGKL